MDPNLAAAVSDIDKADNTIVDLNAQLAQAQADNAAARATIADLQAQLGTAGGTTPTPTPTPSGVSYGANYGTGPDTSKYNNRPTIARLYLGGGVLRTDIKTDSAFKMAYNAGVRKFMLSWKSGSTATLTTMLKSFPTDVKMSDVIVVYYHEPEDDVENASLTLANWKAGSVASAKAAKAAGAKAGTILMSFTLFTTRRNPDDYVLPAGTVDYTGFDLYPQQRSNTMADTMSRMKAHAAKQGAPNLIIGEFGVDGTKSDAVTQIKDFKAQFPGVSGRHACYWSQTTNVFTTQTADAWFA